MVEMRKGADPLKIKNKKMLMKGEEMSTHTK